MPEAESAMQTLGRFGGVANITEREWVLGKGFFARARDFKHKMEGLLRVECQMLCKCLIISRVILSPNRFFAGERFFGSGNSPFGVE